jgi:hypothetical protein
MSLEAQHTADRFGLRCYFLSGQGQVLVFFLPKPTKTIGIHYRLPRTIAEILSSSMQS